MATKIPVLVDVNVIKNKVRGSKVIGRCNNRDFTFYTACEGKVWYFEASINWQRSRKAVGPGDPDYYCLTNEGNAYDEALEWKMCSGIIRACCEKLALHIIKMNKEAKK